MNGDRSLGYWSRHSDDIFVDNEIIEVSFVDGIRGHRSLETINYYSRNHRGYHISDDGRVVSKSQEIRHYLSTNRGVYHFGVDSRGGTKSQENSHSSSRKRGAIING